MSEIELCESPIYATGVELENYNFPVRDEDFEGGIYHRYTSLMLDDYRTKGYDSFINSIDIKLHGAYNGVEMSRARGIVSSRGWMGCVRSRRSKTGKSRRSEINKVHS